MMTSRTLIAAACLTLSLGLGGCWRSNALLLDPAQGARAIPDGVYAKVSDPREYDAVVWKGGGFYELQDEGSISVFTLVPLGQIGGRQAFAGAMADDGCQSGEAEDCEWDYAVVVVDDKGAEVAAPDCKDSSILAKRFGAAPEPDSAACNFASPADVKAALAAYAVSPGKLERFNRLPGPVSR